MPEDTHVIRGINWRETFPFTNIFRSFRVAIHPSKLILALLALLLIYVGGRLMDGVTPAGWRGIPNEIDHYEQMRATPAGADAGDRRPMRNVTARETMAEPDFKARREQARRSIQESYAQELLDLKVQKSDGKPLTPDEATQASKKGDYLDEALTKLVSQRDDAVKRLNERHDFLKPAARDGI